MLTNPLKRPRAKYCPSFVQLKRKCNSVIKQDYSKTSKDRFILKVRPLQCQEVDYFNTNIFIYQFDMQQLTNNLLIERLLKQQSIGRSDVTSGLMAKVD